MSKKEDDILRKLSVPWITKDGSLDLAKFPIDSVLKHAISEKGQDFRSGCRLLASMYTSGRFEASIFLFGLLIHNGNDIVRKEEIVEALGYIKTKAAADLLFRELRLTVSSNTTRIYINRVLKSLNRFPLELIEDGFEDLMNDRKWSYRMKKKFKEILEEVEYQNLG